MNTQDRHCLFADLITTYQSQLYGYIFALVRNRDDAADLFQSVCVVLWRKFGSFNPDKDAFFPWARQTAIFEMRNFVRTSKSHRHVKEELLDAFASRCVSQHGDMTGTYLDALQTCKKKLLPTDVELLDCHYGRNLSAQEIANSVGRTRQSVGNSLLRIRRWLLDCIRTELAVQEHSQGKRP